jgi:hypothetical protein
MNTARTFKVVGLAAAALLLSACGQPGVNMDGTCNNESTSEYEQFNNAKMQAFPGGFFQATEQSCAGLQQAQQEAQQFLNRYPNITCQLRFPLNTVPVQSPFGGFAGGACAGQFGGGFGGGWGGGWGGGFGGWGGGFGGGMCPINNIRASDVRQELNLLQQYTQQCNSGFLGGGTLPGDMAPQ